MPQNDILARLDERSQWTLQWLQRIDRRLEEGDERMDELSERIAAQERRKAEMPGWEHWLKVVLPWLIGAGTLIATGSIDQAVKVLGALGGVK